MESNTEDRTFLKYLINEDLYQVEDIPLDDSSQKVDEKIESVETDQEATVEEPVSEYAVAESLSYKGGNEKGILILVSDPTTEFLNEKDLAYLIKILGSVKLGLEDVAIINVERQSQYDSLEHDFGLIFTDKHQFAMQSPDKYAEITLSRKKIIFSDSLEMVAGSVELRTKLWQALKGISFV